MGGEQYSTGTGAPEPEAALYILLLSTSFKIIISMRWNIILKPVLRDLVPRPRY